MLALAHGQCHVGQIWYPSGWAIIRRLSSVCAPKRLVTPKGFAPAPPPPPRPEGVFAICMPLVGGMVSSTAVALVFLIILTVVTTLAEPRQVTTSVDIV